MAVLQIGALCGSGLGMVLGGWVNETWGWRAAFAAVGVPGLALAALVFGTLREPPRGGSDGIAAGEGAAPARESALGAARHLLRTPTYAWMLAGVCAAGVVAIGRVAWEPTFLREVYGMGAAGAGLAYFLIGPLPSAVGTLGAWLADGLGRRDLRWYLWTPALGNALAVPLALAFLLWPETHAVAGVPVAFAFSVLLSVASAGAMPAILALGQSLAPPRMRAFSAALWSMLFTFVGMGIGPLFVGDLIERLRPAYAEQAVRYALAIGSLVPLLATVLFAVAARTVTRDVERAKEA
jgi:MFS family permease